MEKFDVIQPALVLLTGEPILGLIGILVGIVALGIANWERRKIRLLLDRAEAQLEKLERLERSTSTHYVDEFPKFIPKIIDLINEAKDTLLVFCDIPAYGNFTDPQNFEAYRRAIEVFIDRAKENKGYKLELVCLKDTSRLSSYDEVLKDFEAWREKEGENLRRFLSKRRGFWFPGHSLSEEELVEKRNLIKIDEFKGLLEKANREMMDGPFSEIEPNEIQGRMPAFFWLADERNAIFSIPAYSGEHTELGFSTSDKHLINALLAIKERYIDPTAHDSTTSATLSSPEQQ